MAFETSKELRAQGHKVKVITGIHAQDIKNSDQPDSYDIEGIEVEVFRPLRPLGRGLVRNLQYQNDNMARRFGRILDSFKPDIVHFFHLHHLSATFIDECVKRDIAIALTPTAFWPICPYSKLLLPGEAICGGPNPGSLNCVHHYLYGKSNIFATLLRLLPTALLKKMIESFHRYPGFWKSLPWGISYVASNVKAAVLYFPTIFERLNMIDRVIVPDQFMADILVKHGLEPGRLRILAYGLNKNYHKTKRSAFKDGKLRVGFIGSLSSHKGVHVLVDAVKQLSKDVQLVTKIYGGPAASDYIDQVKKRVQGDPRFLFLTPFSNHNIGDILAEIDVLVIPSIWLENSPLVMHSAQASHCPVIASDVQGMNSFISDGVNGLLFPAGDSAALAKILRRLFEDKELLQQLSSRAKSPLSIAEYCMELDREYSGVYGRSR